LDHVLVSIVIYFLKKLAEVLAGFEGIDSLNWSIASVVEKGEVDFIPVPGSGLTGREREAQCGTTRRKPGLELETPEVACPAVSTR
jgi:hypothetical protein